ncbi:hypothetical protein AAHA92_09520 [Salvia divinorum]|uniref:Retrotransposon gag domain-containing protein n=1 Tax=Salvia divinorum TaxID=28513 RepID=A0ABD1HRT6_SALDI
MYPDSWLGYWSCPRFMRSAESKWRIKEFLAPVTTRSGRTLAGPVQPSFGRKEEEDPPSEAKEVKTTMAAMNEEDPEIGSLNAHLNGEPSSAIVVSTGQAGIEVKNNVLAVMPHFYGRRIDNPYEFLHEFCKLCGIQMRPARSTEEDYRLRALPFVLKGEADTWFMRLPPNSIRTWMDFRSVFLDYFFPATRTNALKKEIQGATLEDDETLSQY